MSKLILVKSYYHKHEAQMLVGLLRDNGIEALLQADDAGGFHPHLTLSAGNNRVLVLERDAAKALEVLKRFEELPSEEDLKDIEDIALEERGLPEDDQE